MRAHACNITVYANDTVGNIGYSETVYLTVTFPTDLNLDGIMDLDDILVVASAFGSYPEHPRWNPIADLNEDGIVDIDDIVEIAAHFGETL